MIASWGWHLLLIAALAFADAAAADEPTAESKPRERSALDDALLENLGELPEGDALDKLDGDPEEKPAPGDKPPDDATQKPGAAEDDALDRELLRGLGEGDEAADAQTSDPLLRLTGDMRTVESLIAQLRSDEPTQRLQEKIVQDIDDLIRQAQQQRRASQSSSQAQRERQGSRRRDASQPQDAGQARQPGDSPAADSTTDVRSAAVQRPETADLRELLKGVWGQLPERQREQMLQAYDEQFLPKYEQMIADYFRSIAERNNRR